mmetsp:Transcript_83995/g.133116  ORF Transcript_83995/g.133116 Transcript_83995/m.133116 type:complete len:222 (-) Transcript_83995:502-1167(-)
MRADSRRVYSHHQTQNERCMHRSSLRAPGPGTRSSSGGAGGERRRGAEEHGRKERPMFERLPGRRSDSEPGAQPGDLPSNAAIHQVLGAKKGHLFQHRGLLRWDHMVLTGCSDLPIVSLLCAKSAGEQVLPIVPPVAMELGAPRDTLRHFGISCHGSRHVGLQGVEPKDEPGGQTTCDAGDHAGLPIDEFHPQRHGEHQEDPPGGVQKGLRGSAERGGQQG